MGGGGSGGSSGSDFSSMYVLLASINTYKVIKTGKGNIRKT